MPSRTRSTRSPSSIPQRHPRVLARRARDPRPIERARAARAAATRCCCRSMRGCRRPSSSACSRRCPQRRVVLATNVAETSMTIPGHRLRRRYGRRARQSLQPAPGDTQLPDRADLAGERRSAQGTLRARTANGICFRLYEEQDFVTRPALHRSGDQARRPRRRHLAHEGAAASATSRAFRFSIRRRSARSTRAIVSSRSSVRSTATRLTQDRRAARHACHSTRGSVA